MMLEKLKLEIARIIGRNSYKERNPLVSVRIPTLNRADLLKERAFASILKQSYKNLEVMVVGDHCTDHTEDIVRETALDSATNPLTAAIKWRFYNLPPRSEKEQEFLKDPEMRWFVGPVRPINKANELLTGKWIALLDDDDTWTDDHILDLLAFAQKGNYEFVSANYIAERDGKEKIIADGGQTWLFRSYLKLFKYDKNCWKNDWNRVHDIDFYERIKKAGVRMGHLDKVVAFVRPRPGQNTIGLKAYKRYARSNGSVSATD